MSFPAPFLPHGNRASTTHFAKWNCRWLACLGLLLFAVSCGGGASPQQGETSAQWDGQRRNVVLISIDSLRRDHVGAYGHKPRYAGDIPVSPNIDALGAEGVVFEDAWTTSSWTLPSHMALMTGLPDRLHGVETDKFQLDPLRTTLAEQFQASGWKTAGYFSGPFLAPRYGFGRGFGDYQSGMLTSEDFTARIAVENSKRQQAGIEPMDADTIKFFRDRISHWDITSPRINELGRAFLDQQEASADQPFFLFLHYFDAHYDHTPDAASGLAKQFDPGYSGPFNGTNWYFDDRVMQKEKPYKRLIGARDLEHVKALYDAEIHWVDQHVGAIIAKLKERGLYDNTIIMVVADHGDEFFDHGSIGHRSTLLQEQCRIPMILRVPGVTPEGRRVPALTRIYDAAPTLLDYAGAKGLVEAEGVSMRELVDGEGAPRTAMQRIFSGGHRKSRGLNIRDGWRNSNFTVLRQFRMDSEKLDPDYLFTLPMTVRSLNSPYFVFDRKKDPLEKQPLSSQDPRFQQAIDAFCRDFRAAEIANEKLPKSNRESLVGVAISPEEQAALDELGYAGAEESGSHDTDIMEMILAPLAEPCRNN
jgi:arylsulfatase A-like enzyme